MAEITITRTLIPLFYGVSSNLEHSGWMSQLEYSVDSVKLQIRGKASTPEKNLVTALKAALVAVGYQEDEIHVFNEYVIEYSTEALIEVNGETMHTTSQSIRSSKLVSEEEFFQVADQVWQGGSKKLDMKNFLPKRGFTFGKHEHA